MLNNTLGKEITGTTSNERNGGTVSGGNLIHIQRLLSLLVYNLIDIKYKTDNRKTGNKSN